VIDIHSHLLPGVDDGSPSVEVSLPVLERFAADGVEVLVCTPHLLATDARAVDHGRYAEIFSELVRQAPAVPRLLRGWEIMLDAPGVDLRSPALRLGDSTAILVEFPRLNVPAGAARELYRLRTSGVIPVLAHPERYWGCTPQLVADWKNAGAVIQLDAAMMLGGGPVGKVARALLEAGLVDLIASDNHGDVRSLGAARRWLEEIGAHEQARLLTRSNAERLLGDQPVLPVPGMPRLERGVLARFKELLLGARR
jgi:protein-tyrosine phosphatase